MGAGSSVWVSGEVVVTANSLELYSSFENELAELSWKNGKSPSVSTFDVVSSLSADVCILDGNVDGDTGATKGELFGVILHHLR